MFWKLIELIVRVIYFRRFSKAKKIGQAAQLLGEGKPEEALAYLEKHGDTMHHTLVPLYAFTRGAILTTLERYDEAEAAYQSVLLIDPRNARADLELALLAAHRTRYDDCRKWLGSAVEKGDADIQARAEKLQSLLTAIENGDDSAIAQFEKSGP